MAEFKCNSCGHMQAAQKSLIGKKVQCPICRVIGIVKADSVSEPASAPTVKVGVNDDQPVETASSPLVASQNVSPASKKKLSEIKLHGLINSLRHWRLPFVPSLAVSSLLLLGCSVVLQSLILDRMKAIESRTSLPNWGDYRRTLGSADERQAFMESLPMVRLDPRLDIPVSIDRDVPVTIDGDLPVIIEGVSALVELPVSINGISTSDEMAISISDVSTVDELPVSISSTVDVNLDNHSISDGNPIPVEAEIIR